MHTLPKLQYTYNALEPYIDAQTLELHYTKHHQSYVDGLNKAEAGLVQARESGDFGSVKHLRREIAFHGSGHILHTLYWNCIGPNSKEAPEGNLLQAIMQKYGNFDTMKKEFFASTAVVEGSGWGILGVCGNTLEIYTCEKHQDLTQWGVQPILVCDVWEHAYYLKYQNQRPVYIDNFWKIINWKNIEKHYEKALTGKFDILQDFTRA